ncbi:MAG TPA: SMP-30/gluconolactonase/LRE family protein [Acetobacteraceae bacterium]|nr:SMP-30/gluconolactonase/LRE family protein [Acetobacteraceae bacterium]
MAGFELVWDLKCGIGESPVWDAAAGEVLFADIPHGRIHHYAVANGARGSWQVADLVASFGLCRSGRLVVALRRYVGLFDPRTGRLERLTDDIDEPPGNRLNDGKVGPDGCFWVGTQDDTAHKHPSANLYRVTPDGRMERKADGYTITNGLAWSHDDRTMFHSDSQQLRIDAWDFDAATGRIAGRRRIASPDGEREGHPDGGACDIQGTYWSAGNFASRVNRYSPTGTLLESHEFPVPTPTMPCFAAGMLYVTSTRDGQTEAAKQDHPALGGLFRMPVAVGGVAVHRFADQ